CCQNLPIRLVGIAEGVTYSTLGATHNTQEDIAIMSAVPNISIIAPCDPAETIAATHACIQVPGPVYLRLGKAGEPDLTSQAPEPFQFGKLRFIRNGRVACFISYGPITKLVLDLAHKLEQAGRGSIAVVSAHTLKP